LSTPIFCRLLYFVDVYILLTPIYCRHLYFVDANILSTPIFCRLQYFVDANILLLPVWLSPVRMGPFGKPPALPSTSASQEPVAIRAVTLALSELQRRYTQPLL
jgi:hypothetical protein